MERGEKKIGKEEGKEGKKDLLIIYFY